MKMICGFVPGLLFALSAGTFAQATKTTETKVGVTRHGIEITRKHTTKETTPSNSQGTPSDAQTGIKVLVDGDSVRFPGQGPVMRGNRVLVPLRGVFEKMGATVDWNRANNTVTATGHSRNIVLPLGGTSATVDGKRMTFDQPALVLGGRALVPLRFLSESLGATVDWKESTQTVDIKSGS